MLDDEIANGSTILELLDRLREHRVAVRVACTHGLFTDDGVERIAGATTSRRSSAPTPCRCRRENAPKLTVLSIAPALAEAMRRIHAGESISSLFSDDETYRLTSRAGGRLQD